MDGNNLLLGEIKGKVDLILKALEQSKNDHKEIEKRVDRIETRINRAAAVAGAVVTVVTISFNQIIDFLRGGA